MYILLKILFLNVTFLTKCLDKYENMLYNTFRTREWRNRQTRTFEGRVFPTYGFKSRLPHQEKTTRVNLELFFLYKGGGT